MKWMFSYLGLMRRGSDVYLREMARKIGGRPKDRQYVHVCVCVGRQGKAQGGALQMNYV